MEPIDTFADRIWVGWWVGVCGITWEGQRREGVKVRLSGVAAVAQQIHLQSKVPQFRRQCASGGVRRQPSHTVGPVGRARCEERDIRRERVVIKVLSLFQIYQFFRYFCCI